MCVRVPIFYLRARGRAFVEVERKRNKFFKIIHYQHISMANVIKLKKGLTINLAGRAAAEVTDAKASKVYGLVPDAFCGVKPKVVVHEGDVVKAGDALFVDKLHPEVVFASPVSGTVKAVERGDRRKVLSIQVEADAEQQFVDFGKQVKGVDAVNE